MARGQNKCRYNDNDIVSGVVLYRTAFLCCPKNKPGIFSLWAYMFDFFDNEKNPFMFIMNMKSAKDEADREEEPADAEFMQMMQQFYMTQMQMM